MKTLAILLVVFSVIALLGLAIEFVQDTLAIARCKTDIRIHKRHLRGIRAAKCDLDYEIETLDIPKKYKN